MRFNRALSDYGAGGNCVSVALTWHESMDSLRTPFPVSVC